MAREIGARKPVSLAPLDRVGWLSEQALEFIVFVAQAGRWRTFEAGRFLYHVGDAPDGLYGLGAGALEITFPLVAEEPVAVHRAEIGFWIGDGAELSDTRRHVSVMAARESRVLHLPGPAVRDLLARRPEHWKAFYRLAALNTMTAVRLLSESLALTVRARVSRRLLALAGQDGEVALGEGGLAKLVGVTRGTLGRCVTDLVERGAVEAGYGRLRVIDRAALERFRDEQ